MSMISMEKQTNSLCPKSIRPRLAAGQLESVCLNLQALVYPGSLSKYRLRQLQKLDSYDGVLGLCDHVEEWSLR